MIAELLGIVWRRKRRFRPDKPDGEPEREKIEGLGCSCQLLPPPGQARPEGEVNIGPFRTGTHYFSTRKNKQTVRWLVPNHTSTQSYCPSHDTNKS